MSAISNRKAKEMSFETKLNQYLELQWPYNVFRLAVVNIRNRDSPWFKLANLYWQKECFYFIFLCRLKNSLIFTIMKIFTMTIISLWKYYFSSGSQLRCQDKAISLIFHLNCKPYLSFSHRREKPHANIDLFKFYR